MMNSTRAVIKHKHHVYFDLYRYMIKKVNDRIETNNYSQKDSFANSY